MGSTAKKVINVTCLVYWDPGRHCAQNPWPFATDSTTEEGQQNLLPRQSVPEETQTFFPVGTQTLVQWGCVIRTWQGRYHRHDGAFPRARLIHCTKGMLTSAVSPTVGNSQHNLEWRTVSMLPKKKKKCLWVQTKVKIWALKKKQLFI